MYGYTLNRKTFAFIASTTLMVYYHIIVKCTFMSIIITIFLNMNNVIINYIRFDFLNIFIIILYNIESII